MSTRSRIAIANKDLSYDSIYCHFDGYIEGVGKYLFDNCKDYDSVRKLINEGNRSSIGYFGDKRYDEPYIHSDTLSKLIKYFRSSDQEYLYLFINNEWYVYKDGNIDLLEDRLKDMGLIEKDSYNYEVIWPYQSTSTTAIPYDKISSNTYSIGTADLSGIAYNDNYNDNNSTTARNDKLTNYDDIIKLLQREIDRLKTRVNFLERDSIIDTYHISNILDNIFEIWEKNSELRLGQLICNVIKDPQLYYIKDEELIEKLKDFYNIYNNESEDIITW